MTAWPILTFLKVAPPLPFLLLNVMVDVVVVAVVVGEVVVVGLVVIVEVADDVIVVVVGEFVGDVVVVGVVLGVVVGHSSQRTGHWVRRARLDLQSKELTP